MHKLHSLNQSKQIHLTVFEIILREMGISGYTLWVGRESKKLKWRTRTDPRVVFRNLRIAEILRDTEKVSQIQSLWNKL